MRAHLPAGLIKYGGTAVFTDKTVPSKLTNTHNTKVGVWGKLIVIQGALEYVIIGPPEHRTRIGKGEFGIIEPEVNHYVRLLGEAAFRVDFYRKKESH